MAVQTAIDHLEVRWRVKDSGEAWGKVYRVGVFAEIVVERLDPEKVYEFEYRSVSSCGAKSAWGGADHTAPALPAGTINLADVATTASDAGAAAAAAQTDADTANTALANIASDNLLTAGEKPTVIRDWNVISAEQAGIDAQATAYGITTQKTAYDNAVTALSSYLGTLTTPVLWSNLTGNTTIVGTTFRSKFADVYATRQTLLNAIYAAAKVRADNAQTAANSALDAADAAQTAADNAQADADTANTALGNIASDNVLTQGGEKSAVILDYSNITSEQAGIDAQATAYAITTEKTSYDNAVSALTTYLNGLTTPTAWNSQTGNTAIVGGTFRSKFSAVYSTRQTLLNKIYALAKAKADNAQGAGDAAQESADAAQVSADQVNVINPGFDSGDRGWTKEGNWTIKTDGAGPGQGIGYAEHVGSSTYPTVAIRNNARCLVIVGQTYKVQALIRGISANGSCYARICWRDLSGAELSFANGNSVTGSATAGSFAIGQAPSGAVYANAEIVASGHTSGTYRADNVVSTLQPSHVGEVPDGGGRFAVNQVDGNGLAVIDFSQGGHVNKNAAYIAESSGRKWAGESGADVTSGKSIDVLVDGTTYGRALKSRLWAGKPLIDFSESIHVGKNIDNLSDGTTYRRTGSGYVDTSGRPYRIYDSTIGSYREGSYIGPGVSRAWSGLDSDGTLTSGKHSFTRLLDRNADNMDETAGRKWAIHDAATQGGMYAPGQNAVPNPSFALSYSPAAGFPGWSLTGTHWSTGSTGLYSGALFPTFLENVCNTGTAYTSIAYSDKFSVNPVQAYSAQMSFSVDRAYATGDASADIEWRDGGSAVLSRSARMHTTASTTAGVVLAKLENLTPPAGAVTANFRIFVENASETGGAVYYRVSKVKFEVGAVCTPYLDDGTMYGHQLIVPGSGRRLGDARNQVMVSIGNYGAGWSGLSLSYTSTTTSATITASAATMQVGGNPVAYNQSSVTVSGTTDTQVRHYLYYDDAAYAGGSQTLHATTNQLTAQAGDGRAFVGSMLISFPASGTGSGTGSGPCPDENAWVLRADPHGIRPDWPVRAKEVRAGHFLRLTDGRAGLVTYSERKPADRVRVTSHHHRTLTCSTSAPLELARADGECVIAPDSLGEWVRVKQRGVAASPIAAEVIRIEDAGPGYVQHITCQNACFWTGDDPDYLFGHHNLKQTT